MKSMTTTMVKGGYNTTATSSGKTLQFGELNDG